MLKNKNFKTILITGASSGLGRSLALNYAKQGVLLFLNGRDRERLLETVQLCESKGSKVIFQNLDVNDKSAMKNWIINCDKVSDIDLVIANAGISLGTSCKNDEFNDDFYNIFSTNIFGVLNTILPIIPRMIERKNGQIALVSSMSSFIGMPSCPAYSSSKACIKTLGESLRGYLKEYNIGVSTICPGFIKTPLTDKNNFNMPMIMSCEKASKIIIKGISKNKGLIVFPFIYYIILKLLRFLPFNFTNYIFSKLPKK